MTPALIAGFAAVVVAALGALGDCPARTATPSKET